MKKITIICCVIISIIFSTSCGLIERKPSNLQLAQDMGQRIMDAFIAEDEDALYELLSQKNKEYSEIKNQIQKAFDFIDGEIISYELPTHTAGGGKAIENGKVISENIRADIKNIETDSGAVYQILIQYFVVFEDDKDIEGISIIRVNLVNENGYKIEGVMIGYVPSN